jgi:hypothetical protein
VPGAMVGEINGMTLLTCERFVFSAASDFILSVPTPVGSRLMTYSQVKGYVRENLEVADQKLLEQTEPLGTREDKDSLKRAGT